ncbi:hypothetical protein OSB04_003258 [Centaurea solstitialis]|uniref:Isopenicillin N synthase-like Fe(2+) 2OG dioxygenase domain-containing protein n=1 Tax=Centaurea solstitialis TaxID=347529 RepID=A0AA38WNK7_9ASTR|nr:hypothetical protein OSB04_003258 [Centaurea solstitialis]
MATPMAIPTIDLSPFFIGVWPEKSQEIDWCSLWRILEGIINECLGLPPDFLREYNDDRSLDFMATIQYPPASDTDNTGNSGHEDNNVMTIVLHEDVGDLEVYKDGDWIR